MTISQYRAQWSAPGGGTGYSVFHATPAADNVQAQAFADFVHAFFNALVPRLPNDVSISFDSEVLNMSDDGTLTGVLSVGAGSTLVGSGENNYSRAAGARIDWGTDAVVAGRRLRGRTFIVPIVSAEFGNTGLLTPTCVDALVEAGTDLVTGVGSSGIDLCVWSRTHAFASPVTSISAPDKGAILRSRRD